MLGKQVKFEDLSDDQRMAIKKLERVYGGPAVTITWVSKCDWIYLDGGCVVSVIFDTGPRRRDYTVAQLDSMGWRFTGDDWERVVSHAEYAMQLDSMKFAAA